MVEEFRTKGKRYNSSMNSGPDGPTNLDPSSPNSYQIASDRIPVTAWKTLAILSCIATMVMYAETMLIPAIPDLTAHFHVSYTMSSWVLTAYLVTGAVMTPIAGKLSDIYGKKKILLLVMMVYTIGVSFAGLAPNIQMLLAARAIQGIGMAMFPIAFNIVRDQFPREKISIGQGIITSMFASGSIIGLLVGGLIIENYGWQITFFTIIPVALALLFVIYRLINIGNAHTSWGTSSFQNESDEHDSTIMQDTCALSTEGGRERGERESPNVVHNVLPNHSSERRHIDILGGLTLAFAITSFLLCLTFFETSGNEVDQTVSVDTDVGGVGNMSRSMIPHGEAIFFMVLGIISSVLFVIVEKRARNPLVDFSLLFDKAVLPANLMILIVGLSMFMVFETIPILVRSPIPSGFGEGAFDVASVQLPFAIVLLIFGPLSGFIISKLGSIKPIIAGSIITSAGFFALFFVHSSPTYVSAGLAVLSIGLSLTSVGAMNIIILATPRRYSGISLGMTSMLRIIGSSIGPVVAAMYLQTLQSQVMIGSGNFASLPSQESFSLVFLTAAAVSMVSVGLAISLQKIIPKMRIANLF